MPVIKKRNPSSAFFAQIKQHNALKVQSKAQRWLYDFVSQKPIKQANRLVQEPDLKTEGFDQLEHQTVHIPKQTTGQDNIGDRKKIQRRNTQQFSMITQVACKPKICRQSVSPTPACKLTELRDRSPYRNLSKTPSGHSHRSRVLMPTNSSKDFKSSQALNQRFKHRDPIRNQMKNSSQHSQSDVSFKRISFKERLPSSSFISPSKQQMTPQILPSKSLMGKDARVNPQFLTLTPRPAALPQVGVVQLQAQNSQNKRGSQLSSQTLGKRPRVESLVEEDLENPCKKPTRQCQEEDIFSQLGASESFIWKQTRQNRYEKISQSALNSRRNLIPLEQFDFKKPQFVAQINFDNVNENSNLAGTPNLGAPQLFTSFHTMCQPTTPVNNMKRESAFFSFSDPNQLN